MKYQKVIENLFKEDERINFDFSQAPHLIRHKGENVLEKERFKSENVSKWVKSQFSFLHWTKDRGVFTKRYIKEGKSIYNTFFKKRGYLQGSILDVGGGWGLFREWWRKNITDFFIVHDPGVERFLHAPHKPHLYHYQRAFSLPMTFVEGFGEVLPYKDEIFDTCLIVATLDHCIYPQKVLKEACRCLRPGGIILVIQTCNPLRIKGQRLHIFKYLSKYLHNPLQFLNQIYKRLFYPNPHLHRFSPKDITVLLEQVGFSKIHTDVVETTEGIYAFEAIKEA